MKTALLSFAIACYLLVGFFVASSLTGRATLAASGVEGGTLSPTSLIASASGAIEGSTRNNGDVEDNVPPSVARIQTWTRITNGVISPNFSSQAVIDITAPTALKLAAFPPGATLQLAVRNLEGHIVFIDYGTNVFFVNFDQPFTGKGRFLLTVHNVDGEIWITK